MGNINDTYFNGYYKDIWKAMIPEQLTKAETDYIIQEAKLTQGSKVLDLMCGYGRHALALARNGIEVTAVDNLKDYIDEINIVSNNENLPIKPCLQDVLSYQADEEFEAGICMGNSVCFFEKKELQSLIRIIAVSLKPAAKLFINSWSVSESLIKTFSTHSWSEFNGVKFLSNSKFLFQPTRVESDTIIIKDGIEVERKIAVDYIYSISETEAMLNEAGFELKEVYSIPGKKKFTLGDPRAYFVAEKK